MPAGRPSRWRNLWVLRMSVTAVVIVLAGLIILMVDLQNQHPASVTFWQTTISIQVWWALTVAFLIGVVVGVFYAIVLNALGEPPVVRGSFRTNPARTTVASS